jgi:hypothetical protein
MLFSMSRRNTRYFLQSASYSCLAIPLSVVFQQKANQHTVPDAWQHANVLPLYKGKGEKDQHSLYRPISLTDVAGKILERINAKQLQDHFARNGLLSDSQYGFVNRRSIYRDQLTNV